MAWWGVGTQTAAHDQLNHRACGATCSAPPFHRHVHRQRGGQAGCAHDKNTEIPALIAEGKGDVMITETYEALHDSKADPRLHAAFVNAPLTPTNYLGFMIPTDDADYTRVMGFVWGLVDGRGALKQASDKWLK